VHFDAPGGPFVFVHGSLGHPILRMTDQCLSVKPKCRAHNA
jgi:hypothetical protein